MISTFKPLNVYWLYFCTTNFMNKIFLIAALLFSLNSFSQDTTWHKTVDTPSVIVHKDPRIDLLVKKQIQINEETTRETRRVGKGYRLLVINTNNREEAAAAKTKVYTYFPELKSYLLYQAPYFRLRVGNFKDREEAVEYMKSLSKQFENNVMIVRDVIEVRPERIEQ